MPNKRRKSHRLQPTTRCEASSKNPHPSGSTRPATLPHPHCRPPNTTEYDEREYAALPVNHATFPNCLCDNSFRDATYDEVYVRFLIQFTSTDFDGAGPAQFRV